jgi:hypothetical protein
MGWCARPWAIEETLPASLEGPAIYTLYRERDGDVRQPGERDVVAGMNAEELKCLMACCAFALGVKRIEMTES